VQGKEREGRKREKRGKHEKGEEQRGSGKITGGCIQVLREIENPAEESTYLRAAAFLFS